MDYIVPTFTTKRLVLRQAKEADLVSWQKNFNNYEVIRNLSDQVPWPYPDNGVKEYWKALKPQIGKTRWSWGIFLKENLEELIGTVDLIRVEGFYHNRGFWLAEQHWGKGIMTEATQPVNDFAFNELGFEKLRFANAVGNTQSSRIKIKSGARLLEVIPGKFIDPEFVEQEVWELTKEEWEKSSSLLFSK